MQRIESQWIQTGLCEQEETPERLQKLAENLVVLWVELPGEKKPCGHFGWKVLRHHRQPFRVLNSTSNLYVCEQMGHLIE